jgi:hypothetical protein
LIERQAKREHISVGSPEAVLDAQSS